jgi:hypothetical protein
MGIVLVVDRGVGVRLCVGGLRLSLGWSWWWEDWNLGRFEGGGVGLRECLVEGQFR